ncbi:CYFA0S13e01794g1_1 [Cyberlindnera fabianii]|uniref:Rhomboid-type serine protease 2 n=1 Tax=Cyberlindnera fabianii TaxID=36022 RepID=A0A061BAT7_CYBFA|nr:CYFA0S13e01794g1_1 [Cyberlindnera fabianii]
MKNFHQQTSTQAFSVSINSKMDASFPQRAFKHVVDSLEGYPPALSIGLPIFLTLIYIANFVVDINAHISLSPSSLFNLDLNRLSFYQVGHLGLLHLLFNIFGLLPMICRFERTHGTVYTGVMLNLFAVFAAIPYCTIGYFLTSASVLGSSGWFFSFLAYFAYEESKVKPTIQLTPTHTFPTLFIPFVTLLVIGILMPGSSLLGHLFGLLVGYAYSFGYMNKLVPPSWIIEKIEEKADGLIQLIPSMFIYYKEVDAKHIRQQSEYVSIFEPFTNTEASTGSTTAASVGGAFQGQGHVVGV